MLSWNVQRVSGGLSMLVQHISELEDWDSCHSRTSLCHWKNWRLPLGAQIGGEREMKFEDVSGQWDVLQTLFFNSVIVSPVVCSRERAL